MIGTIGTKVVAASYREGATSTPPLEVAKTKTRPKTAHTHARNTIFGFLGVNSIFLFQIKKRGFLEKIFFFRKNTFFWEKKFFLPKNWFCGGDFFFFDLQTSFSKFFYFSWNLQPMDFPVEQLSTRRDHLLYSTDFSKTRVQKNKCCVGVPETAKVFRNVEIELHTKFFFGLLKPPMRAFRWYVGWHMEHRDRVEKRNFLPCASFQKVNSFFFFLRKK